MILITEFMDVSAVNSLRELYPVDYAPDLADKPNEILQRMKGRRALIVRNRTLVTSEVLNAAPNLECVGRLGVGLDNIDLEACKSANCSVIPATGANTKAVAEYVITMAMLLLRKAYGVSQQLIAGEWPRESCIGHEIGGKCIGLVGFGSIAKETAILGEALGMRCIACDPFLAPNDHSWGNTAQVSLSDIFKKADIVSLHVPLNDSTRMLVDDSLLEQMQTHAILVNTSRGGIVDESALVTALREGKLGGAALDVFSSEPLDKKSGVPFLDVPNLILTPHIGGVTLESNVRVSAFIAQKVVEYLKKSP
ncbi:MAG: hydroxyacid dehydrogenase [Deltaproteobacteria bacterium]|jgi:(S)-sulfolactate dehydrogenase|nr:hydroxyacid dehydrogenase [Deltaproteobacteria bacterium]MBT4663176.1 hydroxyacid dehydrogenase [Candidatus Neomarinimicrobiota bacterium]